MTSDAAPAGVLSDRPRTGFRRLLEPSLQWRGFASVLTAFLLVWAVLVAYNYWQSRRLETTAFGLDRFTEAVGAALASIETAPEAIAFVQGTERWINLRRRDNPRVVGRVLFELQDAQGTRLWASSGLQGETLPSPRGAMQEIRLRELRHNLVETRKARWTLRVVEPVRTDADFLAFNFRSMVPYLALALPIVLCAMWLSVRNGLKPLQQLAAAMARREPDDLRALPFAVRHRELKPLAASLNDLLTRLARKSAREREFVQDAAHEIRTPLAVIAAQSHVLARGDAPAREEALLRMEEAVARASHLSRQLLALATLHHEPRDGSRAPADQDVAQWLRQWLAESARIAIARDMELSLDAPEALPARVDAITLASIVDNLVDNALRYGRTGGRVHVELREGADQLILSVRDDGPGIAAADRERVFERFWRGGAHDASGAGLGLAIVQQATRRLGGHVEVQEGLDGRGVGFVLRLPLGLRVQPDSSTRSDAQEPPTPA